ncbi:serine protease, partial [Gardnerella vaginalis]
GDSSANDGEELSRNTVNGDYARSDDNLDNPFLPYGDPYSGNIKNSRFGNPYDLSDDAADGDAGDNQDDAVHGEVQVVNQGSNQNPNQGPHVVYKKRGARKESRENSNITVAIVSSIISAVVCVVVMSFAITQGLISIPGSGTLADVGTQSSSKGTAVVKGGQSPDWRSVAKNVSGGVVSIQARNDKNMSKGSGAIIDKQGHVVTNNHV